MPTAREVLTYDQFVDDRLSKVRSSVKLRDLAGGVLFTTIGALAILCALIVIDHWCFDLGIWGRLVGFMVLVGWIGFCSITQIMPPLLHSVNPAYAAKVIEEGEPNLKNRLLNFVFFRSHRNEMKEVVYQAVRQEAASELTEIEVEATVDYTRQVRFAAAMAALVMTLALYTALSPKNPLTTLARILAPWSTIARPSRVLIADVEPKSTTEYFGRTVQVTARIERLPSDEEAYVVFSGPDDRIVDQPVRMAIDSDSGRYRADLPPGAGGLRQDLTYRVEAGDAVAGPYRIQVQPSPTITIDRVEHEFPPYTRLAPEAILGEGDISALEGTRVTIHATTNQPIASAYIEFDPVSDAERGSVRRTRKTMPMTHDEYTAKVTFTLKLRQDDRTPLHSSYQLRFLNHDNESNQSPIRYHIDVIPDLEPEVEFLDPAEDDIEVPVNAVKAIRVRALDPDFQLTQLQLLSVQRQGNDDNIRRIDLLPEPTSGQVTQQHLFAPQRLGLRPGETVFLRAIARDNRHDPLSRKPDPNETQTEEYRLRIVPASDDVMPPPEEPTAEEQPRDQRREAQSDAAESDPNEGGGGGGEGGGGDGSGQGGEGEGSGGQGTGDGQGGASESGASNGNQEGAGGTGEGSGGEESEEMGGSGSDAADGGGSDQDPDGAEGSDSGDGGGNRGGDSNDAGNNETNGSGDNRAGEGGRDREPQPGGDSEGADGASGGEAQNANSEPSPGQDQRSPSQGSPAEESPLSSDGSQDPDVFDRIMEQMERDQEGSSSEDRSPAGSDAEQSPGEDAAPSSDNRDESSESMNPEGDAESQAESQAEAASDEAGASETGREATEAASDPSEQRGARREAAEAAAEGDPQAGEQQEGAEDPQEGDAPEDDAQGDEAQQGESSQTGTQEGETQREGANQQQGSEGQSDSAEARPQAGDRATQQGDEQGERSESSQNAETSRNKNNQQSEEGERQGGTSEGQSGQSQQGQGGQPGREPGGAEDPEGMDSGEAGESGEGNASPGSEGQTGESADDPSSPTSEGTGESSSSSSPSESGEGENQQDGEGDANRDGQPQGSDSSGSPQTGEGSQGQSGSQGESSTGGQDQGTTNPDPNSDEGSQPNAKPGTEPGNQSGSQSSDSGPQSGASSGEIPGLGAEQGNSDALPNSNPGAAEPGGDAANLEYADKATQLVLDYLKDQQDQPNDELLERLGWTQEDLNRFVNRWQQMREAAQQPGDEGSEARRELDQALRSLGLQPTEDRSRVATDRADDLSDVSDAGTRGRPPAQYRDRYKSFMQRRRKTQ